MAQQLSNGGRPNRSEKGLLTPDNCVVASIDHQPQMLFGVSNSDRQDICYPIFEPDLADSGIALQHSLPGFAPLKSL
jgi:hypothetical protein